MYYPNQSKTVILHHSQKIESHPNAVYAESVT